MKQQRHASAHNGKWPHDQQWKGGATVLSEQSSFCPSRSKLNFAEEERRGTLILGGVDCGGGKGGGGETDQQEPAHCGIVRVSRRNRWPVPQMSRQTSHPEIL